MHHWLQCVYAGDIAGGMGSSRPALALRLLEDQPALAQQIAADPWLACAVGDLGVLRAATAQDPGWVHRPGGPLVLPPLVAVTHSCLLRLPEWREQLRKLEIEAETQILSREVRVQEQSGNSGFDPAADIVIEADVHFLNPRRDAAGNGQQNIRQGRYRAAAFAGQGDGRHAARACRFEGAQHIRRASAGGQSD